MGETPDEVPFSIDSLPFDVLSEVFAYLERSKSTTTTSLVSKLWLKFSWFWTHSITVQARASRVPTQPLDGLLNSRPNKALVQAIKLRLSDSPASLYAFIHKVSFDQLPKLHAIDFEGCTELPVNIVIYLLKTMGPKLDILGLRNCPMVVKDIHSVFPFMMDLHELDLACAPLSFSEFSELPQLSKLRKLNLSSAGISLGEASRSGAVSQILGTMVSLEELDLSGTCVWRYDPLSVRQNDCTRSTFDLANILSLPRLRKLLFNIQTLDYWCQLPDKPAPVEHLELRGRNISSTKMDQWCSNKQFVENLRYLDMRTCKPVESSPMYSVAWLARLTNLETLLLDGVMTDELCAEFAMNSSQCNLRRLDISRGTFTNAGLEALCAAAPRLTDLCLCSCVSLNGKSLHTISDMLPQLRVLNVMHLRNLNNEDLDTLVKLSHLSEILVASNKNITASAFSNLSRLRRLYAVNCNLLTTAELVTALPRTVITIQNLQIEFKQPSSANSTQVIRHAPFY